MHAVHSSGQLDNQNEASDACCPLWWTEEKSQFPPKLKPICGIFQNYIDY